MEHPITKLLARALAVVPTPPPIQVINPGTTGSQIRAETIHLINQIIGFAGLIAGALAVIAFIYGGIQYITGATSFVGERGVNTTNAGRRTMLYAATGIVIIVFSYLIVRFIEDKLK